MKEDNEYKEYENLGSHNIYGDVDNSELSNNDGYGVDPYSRPINISLGDKGICVGIFTTFK